MFMYNENGMNRKKRRRLQKNLDNNLELVSKLQDMFPQVALSVIEDKLLESQFDEELVIDQLLVMQDEQEECYQQGNKIDQYFKDIGVTEIPTKNNNIKIYEVLENDEQLNIYFQQSCDQFLNNQEDYKDVINECRQYYQEMVQQDQEYVDLNELLNADKSQISEYFLLQIQDYIEKSIKKKASNNLKVELEDLSKFPPIIVDGNNPYMNEPSQRKTYNIEQIHGFHLNDDNYYSNDSVYKNNKIITLCEEFPLMQYSQIQFAFEQIPDFDECRLFLQQYYPEQQQQKQYKYPSIQKTKKNNNQLAPIYKEPKDFKAEIAQLEVELQQNRQKVKKLYCEKQTFSRCAGQHGKLINQSKYALFQEKIQNQLSILFANAREIFVDILKLKSNYSSVDLHGFYGSEIEQLLDRILEVAIENTKLKTLEIIVGKGLHSKVKNQSVIGPLVQDYLRQRNTEIISCSDGKIKIKL